MQLEVGAALGHYQILSFLGEGGMGAVYLAEDTKLRRQVALKVLPPEVAGDPDRLERFQREARSAAALNHPAIVTIHSVEEADGVHFITMEHLEGRTLDKLIPDGGLPLDLVADFAVRLAEAVAAAHSHGVIHRDLKPENVMLVGEDQLKIIDFGLAKGTSVAGAQDESEQPTEFVTGRGIVLGTLPYMAPEQLLDGPVDQRADVWALGAIVHEMLTGQCPFRSDSSAGLVNAILNEHPPSLASVRKGLPPGFDEIVTTALSKDPSRRYRSAEAMAAELRAAVAGVAESKAHDLDQRGRGLWLSPLAIGLVAVLVVVAAGVGWRWVQLNRNVQEVRREAIPQIVRLIEQDDYNAAFALAREASTSVPDDPILTELWPRMSRLVRLGSDPSGAVVRSRPYGGGEADWRRVGMTPVEMRLPIGFHRFRFELEGYLPVERAIKLAPLNAAKQETERDPAVELTPSLAEEGTRPPEMVEIPGGQMWVEITGLEFLDPIETEPYLIDRFEVSNREYADFVAAGGYTDPQYWQTAFGRDKPLRGWEDLVAGFVDATGRPGPSTWEVGSYPEGSEALPVAGISWYEAAAYCAFGGKDLPTLHHWSRAAESYYFAAESTPLSNFNGEGPKAIGSNFGMSPYGVYDMGGNLKEWCMNGTGAGQRYIAGGAWPDPTYMFLDPDAKDPLDRSETNGVRCMQVPGGLPADHPSRNDVQFHTRDYADEEPASAEVFEVYKGLYAVDEAPLLAEVDSIDESSQYWRRETVSFDTGYDDDRVIVHLFLPKHVPPPYLTVIYFPGSGAILRNSSSRINPSPFDYLIRQGRAVIYPIYEGTYERQTSHRTDFPNESISFREWNLHMAQDLRRTIDYLETRDDLDVEGLGYLGFSWGGERAAIYLAVEDRIRVAVLLSGGFTTGRSLPEADPFNFAPRVHVPVLMLNGFHDYYFPVESGQKPLFDGLGTPEQLKRHVIFEDDGHSLHSSSRRNQVIAEVLDWFDRFQPSRGD